MLTRDPYDHILKVLGQYIYFWLRYVSFRVNGELEGRERGKRERRERRESTCMRIQ